MYDQIRNPLLETLDPQTRHYRFCDVCRKCWYWGKGECHNSDCKRYVAPQDRLRGSPQFCALEATQPPWECEWPTCTENAIEEIVENLHMKKSEWPTCVENAIEEIVENPHVAALSDGRNLRRGNDDAGAVHVAHHRQLSEQNHSYSSCPANETQNASSGLITMSTSLKKMERVRCLVEHFSTQELLVAVAWKDHD